jgi:hypothetical protein
MKSLGASLECMKKQLTLQPMFFVFDFVIQVKVAMIHKSDLTFKCMSPNTCLVKIGWAEGWEHPTRLISCGGQQC